jgi:hypothetical protein
MADGNAPEPLSPRTPAQENEWTALLVSRESIGTQCVYVPGRLVARCYRAGKHRPLPSPLIINGVAL